MYATLKSVPAPAWTEHRKQRKLSGGHEQITGTMVKLEKTKLSTRHTALIILPYGQNRNWMELDT
jgi:hypothetical protein